MAATPAAVTDFGVSKSGSPISRCTMCRPFASSARARARTSKAVSVPSRPIRFARGRIGPSLVRAVHLPFDAGAALRADHRGVWRAGGQHHPVAGLQVDDAAITEPEIDRAVRAVQELGVAMGVLAVAVAGAVRP